MLFKQRATESATLSYLFGCAGRGLGVAVDVVAGDEDWFLTEAEKAGAAIAHELVAALTRDIGPQQQAMMHIIEANLRALPELFLA